MEKRGIISRETTPDVEGVLPKKPGEKAAGTVEQRLDNDLTRRLADAAQKKR